MTDLLDSQTKKALGRAIRKIRPLLLAVAEKDPALTLLMRMVLLRHLEAVGLTEPAILTGGWSSPGYLEFRELAPTVPFDVLLQARFNELADELPGLYGDAIEIPEATLRDVVERLDAPELATAWTDDSTLGWCFQYWNDPDREKLDQKIVDGGKIEAKEIACKTQIFTERYMVEWLLQNSLGLTWLAMCKKHGWTPDAEPVLADLEARRIAWRAKRDAGEVTLEALMPIDGELEDHWKYYVPQPIPEDAIEKAPETIYTFKLLDPAVGTGHFLLVAFDQLAALYREEARHRGQTITERFIAESILENNLHGIDIDPRVVRLAAAALLMKAKRLARDAKPKRLNLVAPVLKLKERAADDPDVVELRQALRVELGIPEAGMDRLMASLAGVDYLGSLFKVEQAVAEACKGLPAEQRQLEWAL